MKVKSSIGSALLLMIGLFTLAGCSDRAAPGGGLEPASSESIEFFGKTYAISEADYSTTDDAGSISFVLYYDIGFIGLANGDADPVYQQVEVGQVIGDATVAENTNMGFDLIDGRWDLTESDVQFTGPIDLIGELTKTPEGEMLEPGTLTFTAARSENGFMPYAYDTYGGNAAPWFLLDGYNPEVDFPDMFSESNTVPVKVTLGHIRMLKTNRATGVNRAELVSVELLESTSASPTSALDAPQSVIHLEVPLPLSHNIIALADGKEYAVNIEMTDGSYSYAHDGGGTYGNNFSGSCQVRVYETGNPTEQYTAPISLEGDMMTFGAEESLGEFPLIFDDYNNDGNPDFTLGQWGGSNGNIYKLFSVYPDGTVTELDTEGPMMISRFNFSVPLDKISDTSFSKVWYDNGRGVNVKTVYEWQGEKFAVMSDEPEVKTGPAADTGIADYMGLSKEEWEELQEQKAYHATLSEEEIAILGESGALGCGKYIHLSWEETISIELIRYVGGEQFEAWLKEQYASGECVTIYSFADHFSMDLETLISMTGGNNPTGHYPLEKLKARYSYMSRNGENYKSEAQQP